MDQNMMKTEEDTIQIFMNIDQKISTLRDALQSILERDFSDYNFWLLDEKCLEPMQSMQNECNEYKGIVHVRLNIYDNEKRIKIDDVLQPAKEWIGHIEEAASQLNGNTKDFVMMLNDYPKPNCVDDKKTILLWTFLLELLMDQQYVNIIRWRDSEEGEFEFLNPREVTRLWGMRKGKPNMDYNKMARSLRYYYDLNIMSKIRETNFVYRFNNLKGLTGYTSKQISDIVNGTPRQPRTRRASTSTQNYA